MKTVHYGIWFILLSSLQPTLLNYIKIYGIKPNLILIFIVLIAFFEGKKDGAAVGAVFGLFFDLLVGKIVGLHAILYMYLGSLFGIASEKFLKKPTLIIAVPVVLLVSLLTGCAEYVFRILNIAQFSFKYAFLGILLPEAVYSAIFTIPMYLILKKTLKIFSVNKRVNE